MNLIDYQQDGQFTNLLRKKGIVKSLNSVVVKNLYI